MTVTDHSRGFVGEEKGAIAEELIQEKHDLFPLFLSKDLRQHSKSAGESL